MAEYEVGIRIATLGPIGFGYPLPLRRLNRPVIVLTSLLCRLTRSPSKVALPRRNTSTANQGAPAVPGRLKNPAGLLSTLAIVTERMGPTRNGFNGDSVATETPLLLKVKGGLPHWPRKAVCQQSMESSLMPISRQHRMEKAHPRVSNRLTLGARRPRNSLLTMPE
jgi:hypothetical protein